MQAMNSVVLEGNLVRDPIQRETPNGNKVTMFSIASNRYFGTGDDRVQEVSFFEIEAWSKLGEACFTYLKKGRGVRVAGRLKQDRWLSGEGQSRSRIKLIAREVDFKPQAKVDDTESYEDEEVVETTDAPLVEEPSNEDLAAVI